MIDPASRKNTVVPKLSLSDISDTRRSAAMKVSSAALRSRSYSVSGTGPRARAAFMSAANASRSE